MSSTPADPVTTDPVAPDSIPPGPVLRRRTVLKALAAAGVVGAAGFT